MNIIDNLFEVEPEYLQEAQEESGATSRVIRALETQLLHVDIPANGSYRSEGRNLVVEVLERTTDVLRSGFSFGSFGNQQAETGDSVVVVWEGDTLMSSETDAEALIVLPRNLLSGKFMAVTVIAFG